MADQAVSSLSAGVFMDDVRSSIGGISNYTPVSGDDDAWVFAEVGVAYNGTDILDTSDSYLGLAAAVATADKVKWIAIKNISIYIKRRTEALLLSLIFRLRIH